MNSAVVPMLRIFASPRVGCSVAVAAVALIASQSGAASQALEPGWQLVYAGQPGYDEGLIGSMFDDGTGQAIVSRAYQPPEPIYSEVDSTAAPSADERTPAAATPPIPPVSAQHTQSRRPLPAQPVPAQQAVRGTGNYRQAPGQYVAPTPTDPRHVSVPPGQLRGSQSAAVNYRVATAPPQQSNPPYAAAVPAQQVRAPEPAAANYQAAVAPQPQPQPSPQYAAPVRQVRGLFSSTYQVTATTQVANPALQQPARQQLAFGYQTQPQQGYAYPAPAYAPSTYGDMAQQQQMDPRYERQVVDYGGSEKAGTIIVDTPHFFLYLVLNGGKALRYGIGVGRPGFTWAGVKSISSKREWPDWRPPDEMLVRRPDLPHFMPGGPDNPLGARALYLGSSLYRIHGSNEPWSIGTQVSSGCIRLRNDDIIDLYGRVKVGAKVIVI
jgi:lipoprotein-anchoring transpeptidase ErfK/SrfK